MCSKNLFKRGVKSMNVKLSAVLFLTAITLSLLNIQLTHSLIDGSQGNGEDGLKEWRIVNLDGDVSLSTAEDIRYWNPHIFRFRKDVEWTVNFTDKVTIYLKTKEGDGGHVATGMWWTAGFDEGRKIPIYGREVHVEFDVKVEKFYYEGPDEWLRIALACAVQRRDGSIVYTETDFLDSPNTQRHPTGNVLSGGDIVYRGGDVVEFKLDKAPLRVWRHYSVDLTSYIERGWGIKEGDLLESVYIVVESDKKPVEVELEVDNFWISVSQTHV